MDLPGLGATSKDVIDVGRVLVEALSDLRTLREQLGPRGSLYTNNPEANRAMDDLDMAEARLQDKLQKFMTNVNVSALADSIRPDPVTGSFVKARTRVKPLLATTLKRQQAADRRGHQDEWKKQAAAAHVPPAIINDPTGEIAQRHLRQALEASSSRSNVPPTAGSMTVRGAKGDRKRKEALLEDKEQPADGIKHAAESRHKVREAINQSHRHALYYKLMKSIDDRTDLHQYQKEAMRSAVLLGRMTTEDMLACIQMPRVFEKMAMRYYKDATGFESDSSDEGERRDLGSSKTLGRMSTINIDFDDLPVGSRRSLVNMPVPGEPMPNLLEDIDEPGEGEGVLSGLKKTAHFGSPPRERGEAREGGVFAVPEGYTSADDSRWGDAHSRFDSSPSRMDSLPPHMRELREMGKRRRFSILSTDNGPLRAPPTSRRGSAAVPSTLAKSTSHFLRGDQNMDSGVMSPMMGGRRATIGEDDGTMVMHAPTLTRREPPQKALYNIPDVVLKRRNIMEQNMMREARKLEEELSRGAAEAKTLHIDHGELRDDLGLQYFHRENLLRWKQLVVLLLELEEWARRIEVKHVCIDTQLLSKVAERSIFKGRAPSPDDLLVCVSNLEEIEEELKIPGWRFRGENGRHVAATWIQKSFRGYLVRRALFLWNQAASFIQKKWRLANIRRKTQQLIDEIRARRQAAFERIQSKFRQEWQSWVNANHVIIHLPSISFKRDELRQGWQNLEARENSQMARLCDLMDPNADVVYISPFPISEEVDTYWNKILQVGGVDRSGLRYRIICPENFSRLPENFSLCKKLLLSPKALLRIKMFVGQRPAFIIPGKLGREEIDLAVALGIPLFAPQPKVVDRFGRKTKVREFLSSTKVNMPPGFEIQSTVMRPHGSQMEPPKPEEPEEGKASSPSVVQPSTVMRLASSSTFHPIRIPSPDRLSDIPSAPAPDHDQGSTGATQEPPSAPTTVRPDPSRAKSVSFPLVKALQEEGTAIAAAARNSAPNAVLTETPVPARPQARLAKVSSLGAVIAGGDDDEATSDQGPPPSAPLPARGPSQKGIHIPGMDGRLISGKLGQGLGGATGATSRAGQESSKLPALRASDDGTPHFEDPREDLRSRYPMMPGSTIVAYELAMLIVQHTSVERWIFKLDDESNGRGFAYIDVGSNDVLQRTIHRIHFDPVAISQRTIDMYAVRTIAECLDRLLPRFAVLCCPEVFADWDKFSEEFARRGGVIEASANLIVGSPYASLVILPNGDVRVIATHELIFCPAYRTIGSYFPQASVPHGALADAAGAIATSLFREGVIGHVGISFVATRDSGMLRLWVIDVDIGIKMASNGFRLFDYLAAGEFDPRSGSYFITDDDREGPEDAYEQGDRREDILNTHHPLFDKQSQNTQKRFYVTIDLLDVRGLSSMPYAEFFSRCRAEGICYDMGNRCGTAFNVVDAFSTGIIGVITAGRNPYEAFLEMKNVLDFVQITSRSLRRKAPPATISRRTWAMAHGAQPKDAEEEARGDLMFQQVQAVFKYLTERVADAGIGMM